MGIPEDPSKHLQQYAHPNKLVTSAWLGAKLGTPGLKVVESDEERQQYDIGHIPTAVRMNWATELGAPTTRDIISAEQFGALMDTKGITPDDTVVIYGDQSNKWALYTLWIFEHYGHRDVRLLDGGRDAWMQEEKETSYDVPVATTEGYGAKMGEHDPTRLRIFVDELKTNLESFQILDLRGPEDYTGLNQDSRWSRHGHIPGAINHSIGRSLFPNSRFRQIEELREVHADLDPHAPTVVYCNDAATAAQQWFVLTHLLGWKDVRVYDGSWVEWGNMMRMPIRR
ncbi:sulfurtransferase [Corynebacterium sp. HMSC28B08]|uniref:sulfurtransferase n=1 Tax=Corynebacterium sp. HMSC28B08 TaxID=1581066 RepID=UPI0008A3718B|nr:sulfurtransferase [Corynebacterium sp. HMSC28B08]OFT90145.1 thiosulfate sulfurtransferase [Corynebacterium sp. HMSC28B08]